MGSDDRYCKFSSFTFRTALHWICRAK